MNKDKFKLLVKNVFQSFVWLGLLLFGLDLMSKLLVVANRDYIIHLMVENDHGIILIPNFLAISYVENPAAAFGLGGSNPEINRWVYLAVAGIISIGIIIFFCKKYSKITKFVRACLMLIVAGAIGNMVDRIFYSFANFCVIDWINFFTIWRFNFNLADSCIVVGAIMLIVWLIVSEIKEEKAKKKLALESSENSSEIKSEKKDEKVLSKDEIEREKERNSSDSVSQ